MTTVVAPVSDPITDIAQGSLSVDQVTLWFDGDPLKFGLKDFVIALALLINRNASLEQIQDLAKDLFDLELTLSDITGASSSPIEAYDFNGDGLTGTLEDFGVALALLLGATTPEQIEIICLDILRISCNIQPDATLPVVVPEVTPTPGTTPDAETTPTPGTTPDAETTPTPGTTPDAETTPAPGTTPLPIQTDESTGGAPVNNGLVVRILDRDDVDGQALTTGGVIELKAESFDEEGTDWSESIQWLDNQNRPLGSGPTLIYNSGSASLNETITAKVGIPDGRKNFDRVSFTLSSPDIVIAPNVKVLPDQGFDIIEFTFDPEIEEQPVNQFRLVLPESIAVPTLRVDDILVGASNRVPPVKVLSLQTDGINVSMDVEIIPFWDLFIEGSISFEQQVDLSFTPESSNLSFSTEPSNTGRNFDQPSLLFTNPFVDLIAEGILKDKYSQSIPSNAQFVRTLFAIPTSRVDIRLFNPQEKKFKTSIIRTQLELLSQVYGSFDFQPTVSGDLDFGVNPFDSDFGLNLLDFTLQGQQSALLGLTFDGIIKIDRAFELGLFEIPIVRIPFLIGPIPSWVSVKLGSKLALEPSVSIVFRQGKLGFNQDFEYDLNVNYTNGNWTGRADVEGQFNPFFDGIFNLDGAIKNQLKIEVSFKIYDIGGPKIGFVPSITPNVSSEARGIVVQPELPTPAESFNRSDKIPLLATAGIVPTFNVDGKLALELTGFVAEIGPLKFDLGRFEFSLISETLLSVPLPFEPSDVGETTFWIGWKDLDLGFIAQSDYEEVLWLDSCFYDEDEEGERQISAVIFSAIDQTGEEPLAESPPVSIIVNPPDIRCPDLDPVIESIEFPRVIEDGEANTLTIKAGLKNRLGEILTNEPLEIEVVVVSNNGSVAQSIGETDSQGLFTTTATLNQDLGVLQLGIIARRTTEFDGQSIVLEDRRTISAKDECDIEPNCEPSPPPPSSGGAGFGQPGGGGGGSPPPPPPPPPTPGPTPTPLPECEDCSDGFTIGDPHFKTLDGLYFAFHGQGEFWLIKSDDDEIQVQSRQIPVRRGANVTLNAAISAKVGEQRLGIYGTQLRVDGSAININVGSRFVFDNDGVLLRESGSRYRLVWPTGEFIKINIFNEPSFNSVSVDLEVNISSARAEQVSGLLGNFDGNRRNDITTRDGQTLDPPVPLGDLYNIFGESWRVLSQDESLFDYDADQAFGSFDGIPTEFVTSETLDPGERDAAEAICQMRDIQNPALLEACIVDVAIAGEAFANIFTEVNPPDEPLEIADPPVVTVTVPETVTQGSGIPLSLSAAIPGGLQSIRLQINGPGVNVNQLLPQSFTGCAVGSLACEFSQPFPQDLGPGSYTYTVTVTDQSNQSTAVSGSVEVTPVDQPLTLDSGLEAAIRAAIGKPTGPLLAEDLENLATLNASNRNIQTLQGLPALPNLQTLNLINNSLSSLAGLPALPNLQSLDISQNSLGTLAGLPTQLPRLTTLSISNNQLTNFVGLPEELPELAFLGSFATPIASFEGLPSSLPKLRTLSIFNSNIASLAENFPTSLPALEDLSIVNGPLTSLVGLPSTLPSISNINLSNHLLTNADPLIALFGNGLGSGDTVNLSNNCLSTAYRQTLTQSLSGVNLTNLNLQKSSC